MGKKRSKKQEKEKKKSTVSSIGMASLILFTGVFVLPILIFSNSTFDPAFLPRHLVVSISLALTSLLVLAWPKTRLTVLSNIGTQFKTPISLTFISLILVKIFSSTYAYNSPEAWFDIFTSFTCYSFYLLLASLLTSEEKVKTYLLWMVIAFNIILGLFTLVDIAETGLDWEEMSLVGSRMVNPNLLGPALFLCLPFLGLAYKHLKARWLIITLALLDLGLILAIQNRATFLAVLGAFGFFIGLWLFMNKHLSQKLKIIGKTAYIVSIIGGIALVGYYFHQHPTYWQILTDRSFSIHDNYNSTTERVQLWNRTIELFKDHPAKGIGTGNWAIEIPAYSITDPLSDKGSKYFLRPHNEILRIASEMGALGLVALVAFIGTVLISCLKLLGKNNTPFDGMVILSGLTGFAIISLFSFPTERIVLMVLILGLLALISKTVIPSQKVKTAGWIGLLLVLSLSLTCTWAFYRHMSNDIAAKKMDDARNRKQWNRVFSSYEEIDTKNYNVNYFKVPVDFYPGLAYYHRNDIATAQTYFSSALASNPNHILTLVNLGTCFQNANQSDSAIYYYNRAIQINENFEQAWINLAILYYQQDNSEAAVESLMHTHKAPLNIIAAIVKKYLLDFLAVHPNQGYDNLIHRINREPKDLRWVLEKKQVGWSMDEILVEK